MELFKGTLHYRCAQPGFVEAPGHPSLLHSPAIGTAVPSFLPWAWSPNATTDEVGDTMSGEDIASAGDPRFFFDLDLGIFRHARSLRGHGGSADLRGTGDEVEEGDGAEEGETEEAFDMEVACNPFADTCSAQQNGSRCAYFQENPESGVMSFDTVRGAPPIAPDLTPLRTRLKQFVWRTQVLYTALVIFQVITFDTWTEPMFALMNAVSPAAFVYFLLIAVLGGFFVVNLFLAVIFDEFMTALRVEKALEEEKKAKLEQAKSGRARVVGGDDDDNSSDD
eukprot:7380737-Prymnesium_polylepis.1